VVNKKGSLWRCSDQCGRVPCLSSLLSPHTRRTAKFSSPVSSQSCCSEFIPLVNSGCFSQDPTRSKQRQGTAQRARYNCLPSFLASMRLLQRAPGLKNRAEQVGILHVPSSTDSKSYLHRNQVCGFALVVCLPPGLRTPNCTVHVLFRDKIGFPVSSPPVLCTRRTLWLGPRTNRRRSLCEGLISEIRKTMCPTLPPTITCTLGVFMLGIIAFMNEDFSDITGRVHCNIRWNPALDFHLDFLSIDYFS
jgi:hypothetical protein